MYSLSKKKREVFDRLFKDYEEVMGDNTWARMFVSDLLVSTLDKRRRKPLLTIWKVSTFNSVEENRRHVEESEMYQNILRIYAKQFDLKFTLNSFTRIIKDNGGNSLKRMFGNKKDFERLYGGKKRYYVDLDRYEYSRDNLISTTYKWEKGLGLKSDKVFRYYLKRDYAIMRAFNKGMTRKRDKVYYR